MRNRKRVTYRPNKAQSAFGGVVGIIFVLIGIFIVIPSAGAFGILWTLIAAGITAMNFYQGFGKNYVGPEINIEDEMPADSPEERLRSLERLREEGLITEFEYAQKREEILREL